MAPEAVVTFDRPEGFRVTHSFGKVTGEAFLARNIFAATFRTLGTLIGLSNIDGLTDAERARGQALAQLRECAELLGANGIVGLRFVAVEQSDGVTSVTASGEAVLLDPSPA